MNRTLGLFTSELIQIGRECDQQHSLYSLSARVNMTAFHFARVFRALVGKPPHRYLLELRLQRAAELLRGGLNVTEACFQSGFNNLSHFSRRFRRQNGVQPSRFVH
jgi:AraC family transcriptional regulator